MKEIKVKIQSEGNPAETLCAEDLGDGKAKIMNIPFMYANVGYHSIVEIDEDNNIVNVLEMPYRTVTARYQTVSSDEEDGADDLQSKLTNGAVFNFINGYLFAKKIHCEPIVTGLMAIAVPDVINAENFEKICHKLPKNNKLTILTPDSEVAV